MKLRFAVNQGECLRRGIDCDSSTITIEVTPAKLPQEDRHLLADRMQPGDIKVLLKTASTFAHGGKVFLSTELICADAPDYAGLMEAVRKNQREIEEKVKPPLAESKAA